ncbi:MAG: hypothetical protein OHK0039_03860 [Bacteroidia bacterium]
MQELIKTAAAEIGVAEVPGPGSNERILQYARESGFSWYTDDDTSWCSVFLNWVALQAGFGRSKDGRAASWAAVGSGVELPRPGDVVLLAPAVGTTNITHVGLFLGFSIDHNMVFVLGGNQSNTVNITPFGSDTVLGYRRLAREAAAPVAGAETPALLAAPLRRGDFSPEVRRLQEALNRLGFNCGTPDGDFGARTEHAVQELQIQAPGLPPTGIFDVATRDFLHLRLQTV